MVGLQRDDTAVAQVADIKNRGSVSSEKHSELDDELDGIHDGLIFPTEEEKATCRRVPDAIPWNAYLIAIVELAERFSYGSVAVFINFIQQPLPPGSHTGAGGRHGQAGALGMGQRASTGLITFYQFWCFVTPLLGGYIADTHWGRFKTICIAVPIALIGHIVLIISAVPGVIERQSAIGAFVVALIVMGLATGLLKANISPLVAEQYQRTKLFVVTTKSGERVIVDPSLTVTRIYMYFYLFTTIGGLASALTMTYSEKYVGFYLAYTLPTVVFLLCPLILWIGRNQYAVTPPTGSVLATALRLFRFASRGKWSLNPIKTYRNFTAPGFWENAKPSRQTAASKPEWMTFDDQWVDEVQRGIKACGVFCWYPLYWLTYFQLGINMISQAATMSTHGIPNDVLVNLEPFTLICLIPVFDILLYPALRRMGINFSALKKITAGFLIGAAAMAWAAVVQHYIYKTSPCGYKAADCTGVDASPLNVWIQTGAWVLTAIAEIFVSITGLAYAYSKAPHNMRSLVMSTYLFMVAFGAALSQAFVSLSADPLLVWNYVVISIIACVSGVLCWWFTRDLDAHEL